MLFNIILLIFKLLRLEFSLLFHKGEYLHLISACLTICDRLLLISHIHLDSVGPTINTVGVLARGFRDIVKSGGVFAASRPSLFNMVEIINLRAVRSSQQFRAQENLRCLICDRLNVDQLALEEANVPV